jgi:mRNA interferase MazF
MIRRGDIYWVTFDPIRGREQAGRRPALVISRDSVNAAPLVVTIVPGTDAANAPRDFPTNVRIPARESGLPMDTVFLGFQLRALDHGRFLDPATNLLPSPVARLSDVWMKAVEEAILFTLQLRPRPGR